MGLEIVRQDEDGRVSESFGDPTNILHRLLPEFDDQSFDCLRFIDWYADTTFNELQIEHQFLPEWNRLYEKAQSDEDTRLLEEIEAMARRCIEDAHHYLKFIGD